MNALDRWSLHLAALATTGTGLADGLLRWFGSRVGEFGPEAHPWLGAAQHLHVLTAPLLVFTLGMMVRGHLISKLRAGIREGRPTGLALSFLIMPMVASGYLVQVATTQSWRTGFAWIHGVSSLLFLMGYLGHGLRAWMNPQAEAVVPIARVQGWE